MLDPRFDLQRGRRIVRGEVRPRRCGPTTVARSELALYGDGEHHLRRWGREATRRPQAKRCTRSPQRVSAKPPRELGPLGGFCFFPLPGYAITVRLRQARGTKLSQKLSRGMVR